MVILRKGLTGVSTALPAIDSVPEDMPTSSTQTANGDPAIVPPDVGSVKAAKVRGIPIRAIGIGAGAAGAIALGAAFSHSTPWLDPAQSPWPSEDVVNVIAGSPWPCAALSKSAEGGTFRLALM